MKKCSIYYLVCLMLIIGSCTKTDQNILEPTSGDEVELAVKTQPGQLLTDEECIELLDSKEFDDFEEMRRQYLIYLKMAIEEGNTIEDLRILTIEAMDEKVKDRKLMKILFNDVDVAKSFFKEFSNKKEAVKTKFPIFQEIGQSMDSDVYTSINNLFDNFDEIYETIVTNNLDFPVLAPSNNLGGLGDPRLKSDPDLGPTCGTYWNQVRLGACCLLCGIATTATFYVLTAACGWGCWCSFCSQNSDLADIMCVDIVEE